MRNILVTLMWMICLLLGNVSRAEFKVVGYIPNWVDLTTFSNNFDFTRVTHLNLAFKDPDASGNLPALSSGEIYLINAAHNKNVKVLLSLCGGGSSESASKKAIYFNLISSANLPGFASKLKAYTVNNNLDGLDLDLEGTAINSDYGNFVQVLADSLHPAGKLLSSALSQGYGGAAVPSSTFAYFDWINIMAYDACGPTWGTPGQHSSYNMAESSIGYWKGRGLPKSKAVLGVPFYGYGFDDEYASYAYSFKYIADNFPESVNDDEAGHTIYYNGISTIIDKTTLAKSKGGGIMIWELSLDATGDNSLLKNIRMILGPRIITATESSTEDINLTVYPNPSNNGVFKISGTDLNEAKIEVYNSIGEKIEIRSEENSINLSAQPKGIYYLNILKEEKVTLRKLIIQ